MRLTIVAALLLAPVVVGAQEKTYSVPESQLTQEQKARYAKGPSPEEVSKWAGVGREVGAAVNSSLQAITVQTNEFAKTGVGKVTIALVVWKVLGDQLVHILGGVVELLVFLPLWVWSYRRTCITRTFKMPDKTFKLVEYVGKSEAMTPRIAHTLFVVGFAVVWLFTIFSY